MIEIVATAKGTTTTAGMMEIETGIAMKVETGIVMKIETGIVMETETGTIIESEIGIMETGIGIVATGTVRTAIMIMTGIDGAS